MNILLLNLTRFGDLLQTQAALADLVGQGHRVGVLCLENFFEAAKLLSGVSHIAPLPGASLLAALARRSLPVPEAARDAGGDEEAAENTPDLAGERKNPAGWLEALAGLAVWRGAHLAHFTPDQVCNLTPSLSARLLAKFFSPDGPENARAVEAVTGFAMDEHGFGVNTSGWAAFLQGTAVARGVSPFNVVDVFRMVARSGNAVPESARCPGNAALTRPDPAAVRRMRERIDVRAPSGCAGFVGFQLGASEERRRWPVEFFAALGSRLWREERLCPLLLGSSEEQTLAEEYAGLCDHPYVSLCGETGLGDLASALCCLRLLVTNDTGTMHFAAGLDVPVLAIFLATAQPFDTGPYREGSCSVEPDLPCHPCAFGSVCPHDEKCRRTIQPELMARLAFSFLRRGRWQTKPDTRGPDAGQEAPSPEISVTGGGGRVWVSSHDAEGFMTLISLSGHGNEARTRWLFVQRHLIRLFLDRDRAVAFTAGPFPEPLRFAPEEAAVFGKELTEVENLVELLLQQGRVLTVKSVPLMRERFLGTWRKVSALLQGSAFFGALAVLWVQETQAEGQDLPVVLTVISQFQRLLALVRAHL